MRRDAGRLTLMATIGSAVVNLAPDSTRLAKTLRIIARHAEACAAELEQEAQDAVARPSV